MTVARILATKGREVVTVQPHRTLAEAARTLADHRIGATLVVGADGAVLGILSERDIVRALATQGADCLDDAVSRHMTTKLVSATDATSVELVMNEMTNGRFRHVPVINDGRLAGLISIGDVVKYRLAEVEGERQALHEYIATA